MVALRDRFANIASLTVLQSAANTLTFGSLNTNMGFLGRRDQALAMVVDEIQYSPVAGALNEMTTAGDLIELAITTSSQVTDLSDLTDQRILDFQRLHRVDGGATASFLVQETPFRKQFFPPLITAERTLFIAFDSVGLAGAQTCRARILFRVETLTAAELIELSEVFRLTG